MPGSAPCGRRRLGGYPAALYRRSKPGRCPSGPTKRASPTCGRDWPLSLACGSCFRRFSSTCRGCSPNGHLPSSDLAVVVAHLPSLGHVVAAAAVAAVRLPSLDNVVVAVVAAAAAARLPSLDHVAAATAVGLPSVQYHVSLNHLRRPYSVQGWGISRVHLTRRHQSRQEHALIHPPPSPCWLPTPGMLCVPGHLSLLKLGSGRSEGSFCGPRSQMPSITICGGLLLGRSCGFLLCKLLPVIILVLSK